MNCSIVSNASRNKKEGKERKRDVQLKDKGRIVTGHQNSFELVH